MSDYDCLIIGYNDFVFEEYEKILRSMGTDHADYRDLNLNFIWYDGKPYRAADILTHFHFRDKKGPYTPFHNAENLWMVVAYLGTYLSRRGFTFDYINLFQLEKDKLREKLEKNNYLTAVITTTIYNFEHPIMEAMAFIREYSDTARIIVGGPFISKRFERMEPENLNSLFKYMDADFYVYSREGEEALVNILAALKNNRDFADIPNIAYRNGSDFAVTPAQLELNSLEENMIDYSLFPAEDIGKFVNIRLSKGCLYRCSFCGFPHRTVKYITTSIDHIKRELDAIRDVGTVERLHFTDDTVNVPLKRFKDILRMMIKENYGFKWNSYFRCDQVDEEAVELMKDSGCEGVFLGFESANETILKNMNKKIGKGPYRKYLPLFRDAGIATFMSVFLGFPGETEETFRETVDFLEETRADFYRYQLWYCDPMTPIWKQREKFGIKGYHFAWSHNTMDAKTACDLLEHVFLSLDTPLWVPDPGYNYITPYLLKQRGMSIERQKTFLRCFNAAVREKLLYPGKKEISSALLESLIRSCKFDEPGEPDMSPVLELSGSRSAAAEKYWLDEFLGFPSLPDPGNERRGRETVPSAEEKAGSGICHIEAPLVHGLRSSYDADLPTVILAAYSTLLLRLSGREETVFIATVDDGGAFPLRLYPLWPMPFGELVQTVRRKLQEALEHRLYAFHVLTHPTGLAARGGSFPVFNHAFRVTRGENLDLEMQLKNPAAVQHLELILEVVTGTAKPGVQFMYSPGKYSAGTVEKLTAHLFSILEAAKEDPGIPLNRIVLDPGAVKRKLAVEIHAGMDFNF